MNEPILIVFKPLKTVITCTLWLYI